jgi:hypothetical protein
MHSTYTVGWVLMDPFLLTNVHSLKPPRTRILTVGLGTWWDGYLWIHSLLTNVHSLKPPRTRILTIGLGTWWEVMDVMDTKE